VAYVLGIYSRIMYGGGEGAYNQVAYIQGELLHKEALIWGRGGQC